MKNKDKSLLNLLLFQLTDILKEANNELEIVQSGQSKWEKEQLLEVVIPEIEELLSYANNGKVLFKYGKKQRRLESTYLLIDSLNALDNTSLGKKITILQDILNAF